MVKVRFLLVACCSHYLLNSADGHPPFFFLSAKWSYEQLKMIQMGGFQELHLKSQKSDALQGYSLGPVVRQLQERRGGKIQFLVEISEMIPLK